MKSLRYNAFNQIHKGLRALLYDTALSIQHTDFTAQAAAYTAFRKVELVLWLFDGHAHAEDTLVFPMIKDIAPDIVADFESQHCTDEQMSSDLRKIMEKYKTALYPIEQEECGVSLLRMFNEFIAFNLQHMNREELTINDLLISHFTAEELGHIEREVVKNIPPEKAEHYNLWMIRGINNPELLIWLRKLKTGAPKQVYEAICNLAIKELSGERWEEISLGLLAQPEFA